MELVVALIAALVKALLPAMVAASKDTAEDAASQPELKVRLLDRVRGTWGGTAVCVLLLVLATGCGTRSVYVGAGEPVRLRETVRSAKVWVMGADGKPVATTMDIPEGWYALPDTGNAPGR